MLVSVCGCFDATNDDNQDLNTISKPMNEVYNYCGNDQDGDGFTPETGDCNDNNSSIKPGAEEICGDLIDNNCDQIVDYADFDGDSYDDCTVDCDPRNSDVYPGALELCDYKDNDCDDAVDEDYVMLNQPCLVGIGACESAGFYICSGSKDTMKCDAVEGLPSEEVCDNVDNDCDGVTDQMTMPCGISEGECNPGINTCTNGNWNCEGEVSPVAEACDGKDNDCDGSTDEDFVNLNQTCERGVGVCFNQGVYICTADGSGLECNAAVIDGTDEICDGKDNDCDGLVDDDFIGLGAECFVGDGNCVSVGTFMCNADGQMVCNAVLNSGTPEICDGIDNNCDGKTDEDFIGLGDPCMVGVGECATLGEMICNPDQLSPNKTYCNAVPMNPVPETCDALDNDCDGETDEEACVNADDVDSDSYPDAVDCDDNNDQIHPQAIEFPDGIDNDCDGVTDEHVIAQMTHGLDVFADASNIYLMGDEAVNWPGVYFWTEEYAFDPVSNEYYLRDYVHGQYDEALKMMTYPLPTTMAYVYFNFSSTLGNWMLLTPDVASPTPGLDVSLHDDPNGYSLQVAR
jgi:hypothetical protein